MNSDALSSEAARVELERLQRELASRSSTVHFAHAGVSMVLAIIFAGASGKLSWDGHSFVLWLLGGVAAVFSVGLVTYSILRYRRGKRVLGEELTQFASFQALRRRLGLDDPSALLPQ